jgi:FkbM family methyltransferase
MVPYLYDWSILYYELLVLYKRWIFDMRDLVYDIDLDLYVREGCVSDPLAGREVKAYKPVFGDADENFDGIILDIGGHVGSFSRQCAKQFPFAQIHVYEPHPSNFRVLTRNCKDFKNIYTNEGAVAASDHPMILWANKGVKGQPVQGTGMHSLNPVAGRERIPVEGYTFSKLIEELQPTIIKIDCEGGEYYFDEHLVNLPDCVEGIAIEIHKHPNDPEIGNQLMAELLEQFPNQLRGSKFKSTSWPKVLIARRN